MSGETGHPHWYYCVSQTLEDLGVAAHANGLFLSVQTVTNPSADLPLVSTAETS